MTDAELGFDEDFLATLMGEFLDESQSYLSALNDNLLDLDEYVQAASEGDAQEVDEDKLNEMFRAAHSLKGLSAMLALEDINQLTHKMENVLDAARRRQLSITREVVDVVFQAVDRLTSMIELLKQGTRGEVEYRPVVEAIEAILQSRQSASCADPESPQADADAVRSGEVTEAGFISPKPPEPADNYQLDELDEVQDEGEGADKYVAIFVDESARCLDEMAELLVNERTGREVDDILRVCHQIKGSAAAAGFHRCAKLTHLIEDLLQWHRDSGVELPTEFVDALLRCIDSVRVYIDHLRNGHNRNAHFPALYRELILTFRRTSAVTAATSDATPDPNEASSTDAKQPPANSSVDETLWQRILQDCQQAIESASPDPGRLVLGFATLEPGLTLAGLKAELFLQRLAKSAKLIASTPALPIVQHDLTLARIEFVIECDAELQKLERSILIEGVQRITLQSAQELGTQPHANRPQSEVLSPPKAVTSTIATSIGAATTVVSDTLDTPDVDRVSSPGAASDGTRPPANRPRKDANEAATADASSKTNAASREPSAEPANARSKPAETIRVDIDRLDQLMNLTGQLVINKARFGRLGDRLKTLTNVKQAVHSLASVFNLVDRMVGDLQLDDDFQESIGHETLLHLREARSMLEVVQRDVDSMSQARAAVNELAEAVHQLDRVSEGIQKSVMDMRMLPIGPLFGRFKRVIRDVTRVNGKDVRLVIHGEKTELDKRMIDEIGDPLIHMIRNAADHGIELPAEREAVGKPRYGTVTLNAFHRGNGILIQISDDGRGIDPEKVRSKAIANGLITEADAERMTTSQIYQLIWEPGFSTAEKVTEVSGRGVGMDIVRSKIEELNGSVELESEFGCGTTFTIKLPLTMAILPSLLAEISGDVFAVPVESVVEIVRVEAGELATVHGVLTASIRGRVISVVDLRHLFCWHDRISDEERNSTERKTLVIIGAERREVGIIVHGLLGEEDIVIKSLAENFRSVEGIAGASILGDGRVSLILDVNAVLELACRQATRHTFPSAPNPVAAPVIELSAPSPLAMTHA